MAKYHRWTAEEDSVLVQYVKDKVPYKDIADAMGLTTTQLYWRVRTLRKKGVEIPYSFINWTDKLENEVANTVAKNEGNLSAAFREIAEKYNVNPSTISFRWYHSIRKKRPIFGVFGRYRGAMNRKNYSKKDSKGYKFWAMIKDLFM